MEILLLILLLSIDLQDVVIMVRETGEAWFVLQYFHIKAVEWKGFQWNLLSQL